MNPPPVEYEPGPWLAVGSPRRLRTVRATLRATGDLRVAHLSDLHAKSRAALRVLPWLTATLREFRPDVIAFTGDFVDDKLGDRRQLAVAAAFVEALAAVAPLVGVNGNHDGPLVAARLAAHGLVDADGRLARLDCCDVLGLPGHKRGGWADVDDLRRDGDRPLIALGHYPDEVRRLDRLAPDLYLAGHTHGGQICLPGGRPILTHDSLPRHMAAGVHRVGGTWLAVSRGIGTTRLPVRLFAPPEIGLLALVRAG